jgi:hypothetical protein
MPRIFTEISLKFSSICLRRLDIHGTILHSLLSFHVVAVIKYSDNIFHIDKNSVASLYLLGGREIERYKF